MQAKQKPDPNKPEKPDGTRRPDNYGEASKFSGPNPAAAEKIFAEILAGGRESLRELIGLVRDPGDADFKNYKAGYVLHGLALYVGRPGPSDQRRMFAQVLAAELASDRHSKAAKGFLIRELQVAGGPEVAKALGQHLTDEDLCEYATQALLAIREGAAEQFRNALGSAKGRTRITLVQALGVLREGRAVAALKKALADEQRDVRLAAAWALANIGDATAVEAVMKAADAAEGWERVQATNATLLLAEKLLAGGKAADASRIYAHLRDTRKDPADRHVKEAAERALSAMVR